MNFQKMFFVLLLSTACAASSDQSSEDADIPSTGAGGMAGAEQPESGGKGGEGDPPGPALDENVAPEYASITTTCTDSEPKLIGDFKITLGKASFGDVGVRGTKEIAISVSNIGSSSAERPFVELVAGARFGFSMTSVNGPLAPECPDVLEPTKSCAQFVFFSPTGKGTAAGLIRFTVGDGTSVDFELCGVGTGPQPLELMAFPKQLNFETYTMTPTTRGFQLSAKGGPGLVASTGRLTFTVSGPVTVAPTCEVGFNANTACFFVVTPNANLVGPFEAKINVKGETSTALDLTVTGNAAPK
jgi:hypothetical protein